MICRFRVRPTPLYYCYFAVFFLSTNIKINILTVWRIIENTESLNISIPKCDRIYYIIYWEIVNLQLSLLTRMHTRHLGIEDFLRIVMNNNAILLATVLYFGNKFLYV